MVGGARVRMGGRVGVRMRVAECAKLFHYGVRRAQAGLSQLHTKMHLKDDPQHVHLP